MGFWRGDSSGKYRGKMRQNILQQQDVQRRYGDATLSALRGGIEARTQGYDQAIDRTSSISRAARRDAITRSEQLAGTLTQRFGAGGKYGTTALDQARMGLASSLTRDLEGIDAGFADLFGELAIGRGMAEAEGQGDLANFQQLRGGQESEILKLLAGQIKQPKGGALSGIFGAAGSAAGLALGGPAGAAIGGEFGSAWGGQFEHS